MVVISPCAPPVSVGGAEFSRGGRAVLAGATFELDDELAAYVESEFVCVESVGIEYKVEVSLAVLRQDVMALLCLHLRRLSLHSANFVPGGNAAAKA